MAMLTPSCMAMAQTEDNEEEVNVENTNYGEAEKYRRSSLALILITHKSERYAREIESQFHQIVPPERYNSHDIGVKVISATSKNMSAKKIIKTLGEMGKVKYQYKRHRIYLEAVAGVSHFTSKNKDEAIESGKNAAINKYKSYYRDVKVTGGDNVYGGINAGWIWNCHTNFAWDVVGLHFGMGDDFLFTSASTGFIFRTNPLGRKGRGALFLWPQVGYGLYKAKMELKAIQTTSYSHASDGNLYQYYSPIYERLTYKSHFDWNVRFGATLTERLYFAITCGVHRADAGLGFQF